MSLFSNKQKSNALRGKTIVITGASSGAGKAAALAFASGGATVVVAARREHLLHDLVSACEDLGAMAKAIATDVTDPAALQALAKGAAAFGNGIDIWLNNAGVLAAGPYDQVPVEVNEQVIRINLLGYMHGAHAVLPYFKAQGHGILINNISIGGFVALPYAGAYSASKAGLQAFGASLRAEMRAWPGIHICDLFPAFLDTPGLSHAANYTGAVIDMPNALLFDPIKLAEAMVRLAKRPKARTYPDIASPFLKVWYQLLPEVTGALSERLMRIYFKKSAAAAPTSGNVLHTVSEGTGIHGKPSANASTKKILSRVALSAGLATAAIALVRKR